MDGEADYLNHVVKFIFDTFKEFENEVGSELGGSYSLKVTIEEVSSQIIFNLSNVRRTKRTLLNDFWRT